MTSPVSRAIALVLGVFLAINVMAACLGPTMDTTVWLVDLRGWATPIRILVLAICGATAMWFAVNPRAGSRRRLATVAVISLLGVVASVDALRAIALNGNGQVQLGSAFTFSLLVLGCVVIVAMGVARAARARRVPFGTAIAALVAAACMLGFPAAQMASFGLTDYRRPADAILVFGARTYADGRASDALEDRMRTACELYRQGLASRLILSGGPGDGPVHETQTMRRLALESGIPESALILDPAGKSTPATVSNVADIARAQGLSRVLAVSHFYHLPRIKMQADRAGLTCFTVPSPQGHPLNGLPYFMAREVAACWLYYLRP